MGKFIDWLFDRGETETAEDKIFKNNLSEEINGYVVDFKDSKTNIEIPIIKYAYIGTDKFEIEFSKMDIEEFNENQKKNKQDIFRKYLNIIIQKAYTQGYEFKTYQNDYHKIYEAFCKPNKEKLISAIEEYFKLHSFYKKETKKINANILGINYPVKRVSDFYGYSYYIENFHIASSMNYKLYFAEEKEHIINLDFQEEEHILKQLEESLEYSHKLQEYVINNSLSNFKIKIKERTDDVAVDMLKIEVMSLIKEDFYQYSHTVYIEKKRLYELIKNDSTFEEILEVE